MSASELRPDDARAAGVQSLVDVLDYRAAREPGRTIFRFLNGDGTEQSSVTFAELRRRARAIAGGLSERTVPGDRVVVLVPPGLDYIAAFFGCLYAGTVAVPAYPPNPRRADTRVAGMVADCGARVAIASDAFMARLDSWLALTPQLGAITWLDCSRLLQGNASDAAPVDAGRATLAMLQYTSGSTGEPRGVMLTHGNLLHNSTIVYRVTAHEDGDGGVFWLPPFHDMGLIGGIIQPIYASLATTLMAPATFLQRPYRWLEAISRTGATTSAAPNFAYDLCVERIGPDERLTLDLSRWRTSFNGAEPIRADTMARFASAFADCGLNRDVLLPCYGLAEGTLIVSGSPAREGALVIAANRSRLDSGELSRAAPDDEGAVALVASGAPASEMKVVIVDPDSSVPCGDGQLGEIWVAGESVGAGYWHRPDATAIAFHAHIAGGAHEAQTFLRTGDLGVIVDGRLVVTGRLKDMLVLDGRKYYPHDIEAAAVRSHSALRSGFAAAFAVAGATRERIVLVAEISRHHTSRGESALFHAMRTAIAGAIGIIPDEIVLVRSRSIPRTSSGKVQRLACRDALLAGSLDVVARWRAAGSDSAPASDTIFAFVTDWLAEEFAIDAAHVDPRSTLRDVGVDSLAAARLLVAIEGKLGYRIDASQLWSQPDIGSLALWLANRDARGLAAKPPRVLPTTESTNIADWAEYRQLRARRELIQDGGDPFFRLHDGLTRGATSIGGRRVVSFASYNYLGLSGDAAVMRAAQEAVTRWGTSVSASRVASGERAVHRDLEAALAEFIGVDAAVAYIGGHAANVSAISHLFGAGDVILCDALAHNSVMQGADFSGARRMLFPHNDHVALDRLLSRVRSGHRRALVVIEGLYSADGDVPDLARFVEVKARHHAMLMVDEAHSLGVLGATGRGISEHAGVDPRRVDIWMGTLSKSLASCGGYIAGSAALVEYLKYSAPGFVFSVGMTPASAAAALAALRRLREDPSLVDQLQDRARTFRALCARAGLTVDETSASPVVSVIVGDSIRAATLSMLLLEEGLDVQPMIAPSVPEDAARLRFFITASHTVRELEDAVGALVRALATADALTIIPE